MRKLALDRLTPTIANGRLALELASGVREYFALPNMNDLAAIDALRRDIELFGQKHDLSRGQINAVFKKLNEHGYYVAGPRSGRKRVAWALSLLSDEQRRNLFKKIAN